MSHSRRDFLAQGSLGLLATALAPAVDGASIMDPRNPPQAATPGATPAFGTSPRVGPAVSADTFAEAEKLVQVTLSPKNRAQAAGNWEHSMAALFERRNGPRRIELGYADAPATVWEAFMGPLGTRPTQAQGAPTPQPASSPGPLPAQSEDIAFAPVAHLSAWIRTHQLTSERLTTIYLDRLKRFNPSLNCVITLTEAHALEQARSADREISSGHYRGPLHGIPWGAKDLLDTAGIATTWGAEPFRNRTPAKDGAVTAKLNEAGAVLVAKLSLGALALNDVWFGGQTVNPWLPEEGASGSSAGPGSAVAAGLVGFAIGSETQGSIISPSMRCGVTGLRPTFGRVPRTGSMTLSWTCDKLGPMARSVQDTLLVLNAISGTDPGDTAGIPSTPADLIPRSVKSFRVGYIPGWLNQNPATDLDRHALDVVKQLGMTAVPVSLPDWPYDSLNIILFAEAAAAFEKITLDNDLDQLRMQVSDAWPNTFRQARFLSAVDFVQADRFRRKVAAEMARIFTEVDLLLVPSLRDEALVIFNFTGHPSLTLRAGFVEVSEARSDWAPDPAHPLPKFSPPRRVPYGVTLIGRLLDEQTLGHAGMLLEQAFNVAHERPSGF